MARTSSAGLPHLTCRADAGQFTYHRSFRSDLVPFVVGVLHPSWSRRTVTLDGRRVVKVSLGTGDRRLSVTQWKELHPVVQAAVRAAEQREAAAGSAEQDRIAPEHLAPKAIRTMAAHVLHVRDPSSLTDPDRLAIARAPLIAPGSIPSEIDALLAANGFELPPGHPNRGALALAAACAQVRVARIKRAREMGRPEIDTPPNPPPIRTAAVAEEPAASDPEQRLSALLEHWMRDKRPGTKQAADKTRYVKLFISRYGDLSAEWVARSRRGALVILDVREGDLRPALLLVAQRETR